MLVKRATVEELPLRDRVKIKLLAYELARQGAIPISMLAPDRWDEVYNRVLLLLYRYPEIAEALGIEELPPLADIATAVEDLPEKTKELYIGPLEKAIREMGRKESQKLAAFLGQYELSASVYNLPSLEAEDITGGTWGFLDILYLAKDLGETWLKYEMGDKELEALEKQIELERIKLEQARAQQEAAKYALEAKKMMEKQATPAWKKYVLPAAALTAGGALLYMAIR